MRIVLDCGHGAAYKATPCVLRELGAEVFVYGNQPDGTNINKDCGSMHPELICQKVRELRADIGIAHDGDADRVMLCDEKGALTDGDDIMVISALEGMSSGPRWGTRTSSMKCFGPVTTWAGSRAGI
jgi:phosphoglucosamine mutase